LFTVHVRLRSPLLVPRLVSARPTGRPLGAGHSAAVRCPEDGLAALAAHGG
jgi:hypothetical protein